MVISEPLFSNLDYLVFYSMLGCSVLIGLYFGCRQKKNLNNSYFVGGKILPVAVSLIASNISGVVIFGIPADVYKYGAMYMWCSISYILTTVITIYVSMPILLNLKCDSIHEYLELRFNRKVRILASLYSISQMLLHNPIAIYIPSVAFAQVSGFSTHLVICITCSVCIFYTTLGGLKAVIWTDTLQTAIMYICLIVVVVLGIRENGLGTIWSKSIKSGRLDLLRFTFDLTDRDSFWAISIGCLAINMVFVTFNQSTMERLHAVKTAVRCKLVLSIFTVGIIAANLFVCVIGLIIYAQYSDCDLIESHQVHSYDQVLSYYVADTGGKVSGLPGLFIAGIFSATLSTFSTNLNSMANIICSDFFLPIMSITASEKYAHIIRKLVVVTAGILCIIFTFGVEHLGGIVPLVGTVNGVTAGPLIGLFILGLVIPKSNSVGALCGGAAGTLFMLWLAIGNYYYKYKGVIEDIPKPTSVELCDTASSTSNTTALVVEELPFLLYRISFWYYVVLGCSVTVSTGVIVSLITHKKSDPLASSELIAPIFRFLLPRNTTFNNSQHYTSLEKSLNVLTTNIE